MSDLIDRQSVLDIIFLDPGISETQAKMIMNLPSVEHDDWLEKNKDIILQAGMEGREVEFRIGGRLFAIKEKAQ